MFKELAAIQGNRRAFPPLANVIFPRGKSVTFLTIKNMTAEKEGKGITSIPPCPIYCPNEYK